MAPRVATRIGHTKPTESENSLRDEPSDEGTHYPDQDGHYDASRAGYGKLGQYPRDEPHNYQNHDAQSLTSPFTVVLFHTS